MLALTTGLLAEIGGWPALKEARQLVARGCVTEARQEGATIFARVRAAEKIFEPRLTLAERASQIDVRCTCPESRRSGLVCAHALAAGLALLEPAPAPKAPPPAKAVSASPALPRFLAGEEPAGVTSLACAVLLPLQLGEAESRGPLRVILEARQVGSPDFLPWETATRSLTQGFAAGEGDLRLLAALEKSTGSLSGVNSIPPEKAGAFLHALDGHQQVWLGKKQRLEVRAAAEKPRVDLRQQANGALELTAGTKTPASKATALPIPGWSLDGSTLIERPTLPVFLAEGRRIIDRAAVPDFLARDWPAFQRDCEVNLSADFQDFILEEAAPEIEAHLEGAFSGLTLRLVARYGEETFDLVAKETNAAGMTRYFPDSRNPQRYWSRDRRKEKEALAAAEAAGFRQMRAGAETLSLTQENNVARFLANTLPRWRREWNVHTGPRLQSTLAQVDLAEPEFSLRPAAISGEDWLGLDLQLRVAGEPVALSAAEIQRWLQTGQSHARTGNRMLLVPTEAWGEMREVLADSEVDQQPGAMRIPRAQAPFLTVALIAQGFIAKTAPAATQPPNLSAQLDPALLAQLRPYQLTGVQWLAGLATQKFSGLLADDMGLGKTLQALAFLSWLRKQSSHPGPALVVCPTSLVVNWQREAARFTPHLRTLDLTGSDRAVRFSQIASHDLLVTSYAILRRDIEQYRALDLSLVILDEAQHIKNRASQNAQAAKALRARQRLILTGTPLENSLLDLWSLFDFLQPGYLGPATEFRERYETPLTRSPDARTMTRLRQRVRPFFLRRTKAEVLTDLPPKLDYPTLCELSDEQREVYRAILAQGRRDVFEQAGKSGRSRGADRLAVLTTLLRLRQVCCHLDLLPAPDEKRVWREPSAKMARTFELIDEAVDGGHRVLLFSQFVRALHLLRDEARRRGIPFAYLDGQTVERQAEVDRFQNDSALPLFFISLKAGGTGLNLTSADTVIHFDPWWNPAVEEQATARAHRLGQANRVSAYKLIAAGTVEEKIQALQARKRELFQASLGDEAIVEKLTGDELEELLEEA